jgi:maleate cis-trans isomerase
VHQLAVAASYPDDVARLFVDFHDQADCAVINFGASDILHASDVGRLGPDDVISMVRAADVPAADAVLVPDTAMHTLGIIDDLEAAVGKPVLTANQVTVWEGLRLVHGLRPGTGPGRLFG